MAISDDAAAMAAATLTAAIVAAQAGAGKLSGLSEPGCTIHVTDIFEDAYNAIRDRAEKPAAPGSKPPGRMEIF